MSIIERQLKSKAFPVAYGSKNHLLTCSFCVKVKYYIPPPPPNSNHRTVKAVLGRLHSTYSFAFEKPLFGFKVFR